jgi:hypothetical protein
MTSRVDVCLCVCVCVGGGGHCGSLQGYYEKHFKES